MKRHLQIKRLFLQSSLLIALVVSLLPMQAAADGEFTGKFEPELVANREDLEQVVFKPMRDLSKLKFAKPPEGGATVTAGRLYHASSDKSAILALLVEPEDEMPYLLADLDLNNAFDEKERFDLEGGEDDNPYTWEAALNQPLKEGPFKNFPLFVQYLKSVRTDDMSEGDRLILESREAFARGSVDLQGKKTLVQYDYKPSSKKVSYTTGKLGMDCDGDGQIDMDPFSAEAAEAQGETIIFRAGSVYVSTRRADVEKNEIVLKSHQPSDYKRIELKVGAEMPDFEFTDFNGKKRKLSEFRGKYVLVDFWGMWCGPCRRELPYLKAAYQRFQARGLEILGMNTDDAQIVSQVKSTLEKNGMTWPQAKRESIVGIIRNLRIHSYPTTLLLNPEGKVVSLNNVKKDEPELRGRDLLKSLDRLLPP